ncbi:hypothetical protein GCM10020366_10770 [Saccharopolyspora gregorii]|uniref:Alpha/beta hydrolase fold-3 domain-containing protein n=1 Tax=Saccharopolyspora gregorii TaxID=33914 RepID=A0ABP6RL91_9PSEU
MLARERGARLARQILIYPMLDDRTTEPDPELVALATWSYERNVTGWHALLGELAGGPDVPATAAPARATDLRGLPPAYVEVGDLDIFGTRTSNTRAGCRWPESRSSCTSARAARTRSRAPSRIPTWRGAPARTAPGPPRPLIAAAHRPRRSGEPPVRPIRRSGRPFTWAVRGCRTGRRGGDPGAE